MDIQKTEAKCKILHVLSQQRNTLNAAGSFLSPSLLLAARHSNTCTDSISCCWDSSYVWAFHTPLMLHFSCSQPTKHPASWFQLHINLLLSLERSRSEWGNLPLAFGADHFMLAIFAWWSWQSHHTCTVKWNQCHWEWWGTKTPPFWFQWVCWIGPSRLKAVCFLPRLPCDSG